MGTRQKQQPGWLRRTWRAFVSTFSGWKGIVLAALVGAVIGVGAMTLQAAGFTNYFGNDPQTCNSCHAMNEQYNAYVRGSHANVATCNDCHAPHENLVAKYINKAENGFMHSLKFTVGNYPENIKIRPHNQEVVEHACRYCHADLVDQVNHGFLERNEKMSCVKCHDGVGHAR